MSMGRPLRDTVAEAPSIANRVRYWAGMADKIHGKQIPIAPGHLSFTVREPLGVAGIIVPWNGPMGLFVGRVSVALACGNGVVLKPSELSPVSALRMAELTVEAGIPAGLVNVVTGAGPTGALLCAHPGIDGISFTGSVPTGRKVATAAAATFKNVVLELGGKAPNVVFADADLDAAVRGCVWGVFNNTGQACVATSRLLVERPVLDAVVERLVALTGKLRTGDPLDPTTHLGPLASGAQYERVQGYLELAAEERATRLTGGGAGARARLLRRPDGARRRRAGDADRARGDLRPGAGGAAVRRRGRGGRARERRRLRPLGQHLDARRRPHAAHDGAARLGTIWGNTTRLLHPALPFGGFKDSGIGNASGEGAIEGNTRLKRVSILYGEDRKGPEWDDR